MIKNLKAMGVFLFAVLLFGTCQSVQRTVAVQRENTPSESIIIQGIRWATTNVAAPGTFAENPEDAGMMYQWNVKEGWSATGPVSDWNSSTSLGAQWERSNDPCPPGWRVPTARELQRLASTASVWTSLNGVPGRLYGTPPNQLFLPAVGWRYAFSGAFFDEAFRSFYWSSTASGSGRAQSLNNNMDNAGMTANRRDYGHFLRCVGV